jgi:hypothetical protein
VCFDIAVRPVIGNSNVRLSSSLLFAFFAPKSLSRLRQFDQSHGTEYERFRCEGRAQAEKSEFSGKPSEFDRSAKESHGVGQIAPFQKMKDQVAA